jgi:uncharacterized membrane protein YccC
MVDDPMARASNGNGNSAIFDPLTSYARISERVEHQGRDIVDLRSNMNTGFQNVQAAISALTAELRGSAKTQWPVIWSAIGVCFTVLAAVGTLAYWPVISNQDRLEVALTRLADTVGGISERSLSREDIQWRVERAQEDRTRMETAIAEMRSTLLPRNEWSERNLNRDHEIEAMREAQATLAMNTQRQLDQQRDEFQTFASSLGNGRDFVRDMKDELDRLRDQLSEVRARQLQNLGPTALQ